MKLIQLNIWQGRLLRQIVDYLRQEQPDFMCLQEVYSSEIDTPLYDFLRSYEHIQAAFPDYHGYFSACYEMSMLGQAFKFGNALFSRYPITDTETIFINNEYQTYKTFAAYVTNTRNLQRATVQLGNGKSFWLINHHAYWDPAPSGVGSEKSKMKMQKVAAIVENSPGPIIFAGDLNVVPASPTMQPIQSILRDLTQTYKLPTTLSQFGKVPNVPCDHVCVSDEVEVRSFAASDALVSDHKALVLDFELS